VRKQRGEKKTGRWYDGIADLGCLIDGTGCFFPCLLVTLGLSWMV
jgi:hypothetical protein